jgi:hypothetical protein
MEVVQTHFSDARCTLATSQGVRKDKEIISLLSQREKALFGCRVLREIPSLAPCNRGSNSEVRNLCTAGAADQNVDDGRSWRSGDAPPRSCAHRFRMRQKRKTRPKLKFGRARSGVNTAPCSRAPQVKLPPESATHYRDNPDRYILHQNAPTGRCVGNFFINRLLHLPRGVASRNDEVTIKLADCSIARFAPLIFRRRLK